MTPMEMAAFVDGFHSERVHVHFDTGNIMLYQFPEHWIAYLGLFTILYVACAMVWDGSLEVVQGASLALQ